MVIPFAPFKRKECQTKKFLPECLVDSFTDLVLFEDLNDAMVCFDVSKFNLHLYFFHFTSLVFFFVVYNENCSDAATHVNS